MVQKKQLNTDPNEAELAAGQDSPAKTPSPCEEELKCCREKLSALQRNEIAIQALPLILHKLKNKLTPILGYSQMLLAKLEDEGQKEKLRKIERNASELTDQLNVLKDYFSESIVATTQENLNRIILGLKPVFTPIGEQEQIEIEFDLDEAIPDDRLNLGQIEVLIMHLVDNAVLAIKARKPTYGVIQLETGREGEDYYLSVKDNGIGIKKEDLPMIWTPFFAAFTGTSGLGLTICEKIIANHRATHLVSSAEGQFTEFKVIFQPRKNMIQNTHKPS